jgi:RNase H-fold protein (predicted Holliday junction resolvase)
MKISSKYRTKVDQKRGELLGLEKQLESLITQQKQLRKSQKHHLEAKEFIKVIGLKTQKEITYNINEITSMALSSVLEEPYDLELEFVERRNKTECDIRLIRDDIKIHPFQGGGGAVDIAAFALRVAAWAMQSPKSRNILILDEPFKHLKGEQTNQKMLAMLQEITKKLGIQILMVSDERVSREATESFTDRLFETTIRKGISKIKQI